jgi:hypothetical protein
MIQEELEVVGLKLIINSNSKLLKEMNQKMIFFIKQLEN